MMECNSPTDSSCEYAPANSHVTWLMRPVLRLWCVASSSPGISMIEGRRGGRTRNSGHRLPDEERASHTPRSESDNELPAHYTG